MRPIQIILLASTVAALLLYFREVRSRLLNRVVAVSIGLAAAVLIVNPDWSMGIAHAFGVGRGVDLIMYLALLWLGFVYMALVHRVRQLERELTRLARELALRNAEVDSSGGSAAPPSA